MSCVNLVLEHPYIAIAVLSYLKTFTSNLSLRTGWRAAKIGDNILGALPAIDLSGLATAGRKPTV